jgi:hypothetical protein
MHEGERMLQLTELGKVLLAGQCHLGCTNDYMLIETSIVHVIILEYYPRMLHAKLSCKHGLISLSMASCWIES